MNFKPGWPFVVFFHKLDEMEHRFFAYFVGECYICNMKQLRAIFAGMLACGTLAVSAQINSPMPAGYLDRARMMTYDYNFQGVADQARQASPGEERAWLRAIAALCTDNEDAFGLLTRFLEEYPASPLRLHAQMGLADLDFADGLYADALDKYIAIGKDSFAEPLSDRLALRRAYCRLMLGDYNRAEEDLVSLENSPKLAKTATFYRAYLAYAQRQFDKAREMFAKCDRSAYPGSAAPFYEMQIDFAEGQYEDAYNRAMTLLSTHGMGDFDAESNRIAGESLYNLGRTDEGLPYLWTYASLVENPAPSALYILGVSEFDQGNWDNAIKLLQRAVPAGNAMGQSAYLLLGQAYQQRGDNDAAVMAFEQAYRQNYDRKVQETAFYNYAVANVKGGKVPFGSSVALMESFLKEFPKSSYAPTIEEYLVNGYMSENDYEHALEALDRVKNSTPQLEGARQRVLFVLGSREYQAGNYRLAEEHLRKAAALDAEGTDPSIQAQSHLWLGDCMMQSDDYAGAAQQYKDYLSATSKTTTTAYNRMVAEYNLGYALFNSKNYKGAEADFKTALELGRKAGAQVSVIADIQNRLADCRYYQGDYAGAADLYNQAYVQHPDNGDYALFQLAMVRGAQGKYADKIARLDDLMKRFPGSSLIPTALLEKAQSQVSMGDGEAAETTYRMLTEQYPESPAGRNGYLQMAMALMQNGQRDAAVEAYKTVVMNYPTSSEAQVAADDLKNLYAKEGHLVDFVDFINSVPNAPKIEQSTLEAAAFEAAENQYADNGKTELIESYLAEYTDGSNRPQALYYLAEASWKAGKYAQTVTRAQEVVTRYPHSEAARYAMLLKADAEAAQGKHEAALVDYRTLEQNASDAQTIETARLGVLRSASVLGRNNEVIDLSADMLASSSTNEVRNEVSYRRALALDAMKKFNEADVLFKSLAQNPADLYGSMGAVAYGQSLLDRGQADAAANVVNDFIDADPPHQYWLARGFILYSDILRKQGKKFEADEYLRSLRDNYPGKEADITTMINRRLNP